MAPRSVALGRLAGVLRWPAFGLNKEVRARVPQIHLQIMGMMLIEELLACRRLFLSKLLSGLATR